MNSSTCACQRLDPIESRLIRTRALLIQTQNELLEIRRDLDLDSSRKKWLDAFRSATAQEIVPLDELEKQAILRAVSTLGIAKATKALGIGKTTLYRKLNEYGWEVSARDGSATSQEVAI